MNTKYLSLAVLLLAGVAQGALAQDQQPNPGGRSWGRGETHGGEAHRGQAPAPRPPAAAPRPPSPPQARPAPEPRALRSWRGGDPAHEGNIAGERDWGGHRRETAPGDAGRPDGSQRPWGQRDGGQRDGSWRGGSWRDGSWRGGDHTPPARPDGGPRDDRRWNEDHRRWNGDDRQGRPAWEHDGRVRPGQAPVWRPRVYPPIYNSRSRYHHAWRAPPGYYARSWRYGEILPGGWYARDYWISDWWAYDLPEPPYGYAWVRAGPDVLLVDVYSGRIVQVVRLLFW